MPLEGRYLRLRAMNFILTVLGVVLIIEGLPYFAFPGRIKEWALALQEVSDGGLRAMGFVAMATGLLILYIVRYLLA